MGKIFGKSKDSQPPSIYAYDSASFDGDNASSEVNSLPESGSSPHPKWNTSEFQCSICYELLLNPVVGSCGHDFCKHCIEEWKVSRQLVGQAVLCPVCRSVLLSSTDQSFGVCIRLRETIEKLFPEQISLRRRQVGLAEKSRKCSAGGSGPSTFPRSSSSPSGSTATSTATDTSAFTTTITSSGTPSSNGSPHSPSANTLSGGSPGPPTHGAPGSSYPVLDLELLNRAAKQYRELSMLVSAITSVPAPPATVVQSFTQAAAHMAERAANQHYQQQHWGGAVGSAGPLPPQHAAELARLFLSSGAALTTTASAATLAPPGSNPHHASSSIHHQHLSSSHPQYGAQVAASTPTHPFFAVDPSTANSTAAAVAAMSSHDAATAAALAAQLATAAAAAGGGVPQAAAVLGDAGSNAVSRGGGGGGFLEAALTLLTSAAATSSAAGQLCTLVSALHYQQRTSSTEAGGDSSMTESGGGGGPAMTAATVAADDALRTTANTVQQLTAEAAAISHLLRLHHQQQLQAHMAVAAHAQMAHHLQAQRQASSSTASSYLGQYLVGSTATASHHHPVMNAQQHPGTLHQMQQPQVLLSVSSTTTATATTAPAATAPMLLLGSAPTTNAGGLHSYISMPYRPLPSYIMSPSGVSLPMLPVLTANASPGTAADAVTHSGFETAAAGPVESYTDIMAQAATAWGVAGSNAATFPALSRPVCVPMGGFSGSQSAVATSGGAAMNVSGGFGGAMLTSGMAPSAAAGAATAFSNGGAQPA